MKKVSAYTIMEVTLVMILSAIAVGIVYTALNIVTSSHRNFNLRNSELSDLALTERILNRDFLESSQIIRTTDGVSVDLDSISIGYEFNKGFIVRDHNGIRKDTFHVEVEAWNSAFRGNRVFEGLPLDELSISVIINNRKVNLLISKWYSSANLYK